MVSKAGEFEGFRGLIIGAGATSIHNCNFQLSFDILSTLISSGRRENGNDSLKTFLKVYGLEGIAKIRFEKREECKGLFIALVALKISHLMDEIMKKDSLSVTRNWQERVVHVYNVKRRFEQIR
ncbi:hypothetical protein SLE2022_102250 [Rubroshorea leprosula]